MTIANPLGALAVTRATASDAPAGFVGTKRFPDFEWAGESALYEKPLSP